MAIYAIDFDNTLAITRFPEIVAPNKKMVAFAKAVKAQGHQIILWTSRAGADLENAVEWCRLQGLVFDAVNEPLPEQILSSNVVLLSVLVLLYVDVLYRQFTHPSFIHLSISASSNFLHCSLYASS